MTEDDLSPSWTRARNSEGIEEDIVWFVIDMDDGNKAVRNRSRRNDPRVPRAIYTYAWPIELTAPLELLVMTLRFRHTRPTNLHARIVCLESTLFDVKRLFSRERQRWRPLEPECQTNVSLSLSVSRSAVVALERLRRARPSPFAGGDFLCVIACLHPLRVWRKSPSE